MQPFLTRVVIRAITLPLGVIGAIPVLIHMLYIFMRHPMTFFKKVKRSCAWHCRTARGGGVGGGVEPSHAFHTADPLVVTDASLGQHDFLTVNGIKIHYVENGPRTAPLMLCLHGFPEVRLNAAPQTA